jgi:preprotein translocase subunit SecG
MGVRGILLLVFFVIIAILLILLVLVQNEEGDSLGGIFAGGSGSAFGSRSGNVLTRTTSLLGALFLIISLGLALVNRSPGDSGVEAAGRQSSSGANKNWWLEDTPAPEAVTPDAVAPVVAPEAIAPEVVEPEPVPEVITPEAAPAPVAVPQARVPEAVAPAPEPVAVPQSAVTHEAGAADEASVPEAEVSESE